jgi:hypothetical protein
MLNTTIAALVSCACTDAMRLDYDCCAWCEMVGLHSDLYKDAYGIRPRRDWTGYTTAEIQADIDLLPKYDPEQEAREREEARLRVMPLNGEGWTVNFVGETEVARNRFMEHVDISPECLY